MIDRLTGTLVQCDLTAVVLDVQGVGYAITVPMSTYDKLPRSGEDIQIFTHLHIREDLMQLFGFWTQTERRLFRLLITISGIGPRLALNVLSCMTVANFCQAIVNADSKGLTRVNGLGKRSAERLIVELKERIGQIEPEISLAAAAAGGDAGDSISPEAQDAVAALETLGFKAEVARRSVQALCNQLPKTEQSAENLIRKALKSLNS